MPSMPGLYYDRQGLPIEMLEWATIFEDPEYKQIRVTELPDGREVSTVWLGMNHNFHGGPPLIFETMVFPAADYQERYSTEAEAIAGHEALVAELTNAAPLDTNKA